MCIEIILLYRFMCMVNEIHSTHAGVNGFHIPICIYLVLGVEAGLFDAEAYRLLPSPTLDTTLLGILYTIEAL